MTNEDIVKIGNAALLYFTTTDLSEDEEQEFLDYYLTYFDQQEGAAVEWFRKS